MFLSAGGWVGGGVLHWVAIYDKDVDPRGPLQLLIERGDKDRTKSAATESIPGGGSRAVAGDMISGVSHYYFLTAML